MKSKIKPIFNIKSKIHQLIYNNFKKGTYIPVFGWVILPVSKEELLMYIYNRYCIILVKRNYIFMNF